MKGVLSICSLTSIVAEKEDFPCVVQVAASPVRLWKKLHAGAGVTCSREGALRRFALSPLLRLAALT